MVNAWLVRKSGPLAGARHLLRDDVTRVGRGPENDLVIDESTVVSVRHLEIRRDGDAYRVFDAQSTNGTYLNGQPVHEALIEPPATIQLGTGGPELAFLIDLPAHADLNETMVVSAPAAPHVTSAAADPSHTHDELLSHAVARARMARRTGMGDQTMVIMRELLKTALHRTRRRFKRTIAVLTVALLVAVGYSIWRIQDLRREKAALDAEIQRIEALLAKSGPDAAERERLVDRLNVYQSQARALQTNLLYRFGVRQQEEFLQQEIKALLAEFGAEVYSIPPEFEQQVQRYIEQYQGPNRPHMVKALGEARHHLDTIRSAFQKDMLPPDLGYMVLVESAFNNQDSSPAGAAGYWQFTPSTARAFGLKVTSEVDERLDLRKSTRAACQYMRELILDFGAGSSVMLALAAYNSGPPRVKQAIRKVSDPIKQRDFWYLYRVRALPAETREYVPKVIAAMIIGRNPEKFGF